MSLGALQAHMIGMRHIILYLYSPVVIKIAFGRELLFFTNMGVGGIIYEAIQKFICINKIQTGK